jgi:hypothetical protein
VPSVVTANAAPRTERIGTICCIVRGSPSDDKCLFDQWPLWGGKSTKA